MAFNWFKHKKKGSEASPGKPPSDEPPPSSEIEPAAVKHLQDSPETPAQNQPDNSDVPGFFKRLKLGLAKTRENFSGEIEKIFSDKKRLDDALLEELEELLITSDIGVQTAFSLIETISASPADITDAGHFKAVLKNEILARLAPPPPIVQDPSAKPFVSMIVGVNGVGKTTTIGKIAAKSVAAGQKVLIAAADTFRAAAVEQLAVWTQRAGAEIVKHKTQADPAAVVYDSLEAALARKADLLLIDTAGRLHTKVNLMEELRKIKRTIAKKIAGAPHEILLVLDATTGQNAVSQAELFNEALGITGLVITKLDGTAKGGIVVGINHALKIPIKYIGVGEKIDDLQPFDPQQFVDALF